MYLTKRKPSFTPDEFTRRWRMHGALGMSSSFWRHYLLYVQAEPIRPVPVAGASDQYDGVAYIITRNEAFDERLLTPQDNEDGEKMLRDEYETFESPITPRILWVEEDVIRPCERGGVTAFFFLLDAGRASRTAERYAQCDRVNRVVVNRRRNDIQLGSAKSVLPYQAVVEIAASSVTHLKEVLDSIPTPVSSIADLTIITREAVLWDRLFEAHSTARLANLD
jgi:hypothetical protein